jgi:hypothetical protein
LYDVRWSSVPVDWVLFAGLICKTLSQRHPEKRNKKHPSKKASRRGVLTADIEKTLPLDGRYFVPVCSYELVLP